MKTEYGLSSKTIDAVRLVLAGHPEVERAVLFGSRAKGTYRRGSDIDLALVGEGISQRTLNSLYETLDELPIPYEFSLVSFSGITDPDVRAHIERVGTIFFERRETVSASSR